MLDDLRQHEARVYSQGGEDGVLERIFAEIGVTNRRFVEFGAKDGVFESNTARLRLERGWRGLLLEGDVERARQGASAGVRHDFVTAENIEQRLAAHGVPERFDLLSIDIDGNDYWIWRAIRRFRPRVVVIEYNIGFALHESFTIRYDPAHRWDRSGYHGASLAALRWLGRAKGYVLVHTDSWSPNAFFVDRACLPADLVEPAIHEVAAWGGKPAGPARFARPWVEVG